MPFEEEQISNLLSQPLGHNPMLNTSISQYKQAKIPPTTLS
jgi:hypothetical protein